MSDWIDSKQGQEMKVWLLDKNMIGKCTLLFEKWDKCLLAEVLSLPSSLLLSKVHLPKESQSFYSSTFDVNCTLFDQSDCNYLWLVFSSSLYSKSKFWCRWSRKQIQRKKILFDKRDQLNCSQEHWIEKRGWNREIGFFVFNRME